VRTILSLCDYSGNWSKPYRDAGYRLALMPATPAAVEPTLGDRTTAIAAGRRRSTTPLGFAVAFFEANP
jgi:hypothetical protein